MWPVTRQRLLGQQECEGVLRVKVFCVLGGFACVWGFACVVVLRVQGFCVEQMAAAAEGLPETCVCLFDEYKILGCCCAAHCPRQRFAPHKTSSNTLVQQQICDMCPRVRVARDTSACP